jgi:hypothetical protein
MARNTKRHQPPPWRGGPEHPPEGLRQSRCGCATPSVSFYKMPFKAKGKSSYHVVAVCLTCGRNAAGPGCWLPRKAVHEPDKLPLMPSWLPRS